MPGKGKYQQKCKIFGGTEGEREREFLPSTTP